MKSKAAWILSLLAFLMFGFAAGLGLFTFHFAQGTSYMTNDPAACANCHIMQEYFDGWVKGSHHANAVCNDCHAPANAIGKLATKAINGFNHSLAFTFGTYKDVLTATSMNKKIAERSCLKCHQQVVSEINTHAHGSGSMNCVRCHANVGHARE